MPCRAVSCLHVAGVAKYGTPVSLDAEGLKVDLIVVGSSAVDPSNGARLGKGEVGGWAGAQRGLEVGAGAMPEWRECVHKTHSKYGQ